jgi:membrane protein YqaA with SNARE-associated domain
LVLSSHKQIAPKGQALGNLAVYSGLFGISFLAATILPAQSELGLAGLIISGDYNVWLLIAVASIGNTLGAVVNWGLGRGVERLRGKKWFPATSEQLDRATRWYHKYGRWSLLMSWAPIIGDPLTLAAGVLREPIGSFLVLVAVAKMVRYLFVAAIALNLF